MYSSKNNNHQQQQQQQQHHTISSSGNSSTARRASAGSGPAPKVAINPLTFGAPTSSQQRHQMQLQHQQQQLQQFYSYTQSLVPSSVFDEDPGIMSEVETSATGFRRSTKARSSLPIVRTPSKTQDRSLGLVFLQYRSETKRALLPNEITSMDTVKALFVRSFPRQLTMDYLESKQVRIYIHDHTKDMFYELEELADIKDRSVLRIYEQDLVNGAWVPVGGGQPIPATRGWNEDLSYFSEPEFDSEYQAQHVHRTGRGKNSDHVDMLVASPAQSQYYGTIIMPPQYRAQAMMARGYGQQQQQQHQQQNSAPRQPDRVKPYPGYSQTLPRGTHLVSASSAMNNLTASVTNPNLRGSSRDQSPDFINKSKSKDQIGQISSAPPKPQRAYQATVAPQSNGNNGTGRDGPPSRRYPPPSSSATYQNRPLPSRPYSAAGQYAPDRRGPTDYSGYLSSPERRVPPQPVGPIGTRTSFPPGYQMSYDDMYGSYGMRSSGVAVDEEARVRMQLMERQLASLTGLVQKALTPQQLQQQQLQMQQARQGPTGSEQKEKQKPPPPPKPASLVNYRGPADGSSCTGGSSNVNLTLEAVNHLKQMRKKTKDLRNELRSLRRTASSQANLARETLKDSCFKIKASLSFMNISDPIERQLRFERLKLCRDEDLYKLDVGRLEKDLRELEGQVEELRGNVINRRCRVNMGEVEAMALVLSRASKTVADLKMRYPAIQDNLKEVLSQEMALVVQEERFLKEEPERLDLALRRCKKLTGTLVTLKRLASVQEQRPTGLNAHGQLEKSASADSSGPLPPPPRALSKDSAVTRELNEKSVESHTIIQVTPATPTLKTDPQRENSLDELLDQLQTFSKPIAGTGTANSGSGSGSKDFEFPRQAHPARRHFGSFDGTSLSSSGKKPVPLPPPRSSSSRIRDPEEQKRQLMLLSSLTAAAALANTKVGLSTVVRSNSEPTPLGGQRSKSTPPSGLDDEEGEVGVGASSSSLSSVESQDSQTGKSCRQQVLEERHQELLRKQKLLQEQYQKLQQLSKGTMSKSLIHELKKTGSESNIMVNSLPKSSSGSLTQLAPSANGDIPSQTNSTGLKGKGNYGKLNSAPLPPVSKTETQKIYETDIL